MSPPAGQGPGALSPGERLRLGLTVRLLQGILAGLGGSCRYVHLEGAARPALLRSSGRRVIFACWHEQAFLATRYIHRSFLARGMPFAILVSRSKDGELGARLARRLGASVVRGSASRGGTEGLRRLYREIARHGASAVFLPDGPRGPAYRVKPGAVVLAQAAGLPIVPLGFAASRSWRLSSWDRMQIPRPFSRIGVVLGEPVRVPARLDSAGLEAECSRIGRLLDEAAAAARQGVAAVGPGRST